MSDAVIKQLRASISHVLADDRSRLTGMDESWRQAQEEAVAEISAEAPATLADLWNCYRLLLNRAPDPIGTPHHLERVREGITVHDLVRRFLVSAEHQALFRPSAPHGPGKMIVNGLELVLPPPRTAADLRVRATGRHKPHLAGALGSVLLPGMYVLDIGAGAGEFAVPAARKVGPAGRVVALEPHPLAMRALLANVTAFGLDNIDILPFCAADRDGFLTLVSENGIATARSVTAEHLTSASDDPIVYARTVDSIMLAGRRVDMIVIGLDGYDHQAVKGALATLAKWLPHFFGNYAPGLLATYSGIDPRDYLMLLREMGYRRFTGMSAQHGPVDLGSDIDALARLPEQLGIDRIDFYAWTA